MLAVVCLAFAFVSTASADVIAVGQLQECIDDHGVSCGMKMLVTMTIQNGQGPTESITSYQVTSLTDAAGLTYQVHDRLQIELSKSLIGLKYPLTYVREFNNKPFELVRTKDGHGVNYDPLFNPCSDGLNSNSACGMYVDINTMQPVPYSAGFCCACSMSDYLGLSSTSMSRAGLDCSLFSGGPSEAGHCMRFDPLWYSAFSIQPPMTTYDITVAVTHCNDTYCGPDTDFTLSPSHPGVCVNRSDYGPPAAGCNIRMSLEGDFAAFQDPPSFESKLLFVPYACDDVSQCFERLTETSDRWMLLDKSDVTMLGTDCNKIGVSFSGFYGQGNRCSMMENACLAGQLQDYYTSDEIADLQGVAGSSFVKYHSMGAGFAASTSVLSNANPAMTFYTNRFQKSVVTMVIAADSIKYTLFVSSASIVDFTANNFDAYSLNGHLAMVLQNDGSNMGEFTVDISCSDGFLPIDSVQVSIPPNPATATLLFNLHTSTNTAHDAVCVATVLDSLFRQNAVQMVSFNVSSYKPNKGPQGGQLSAGAPTSSDGNSSASSNVACDKACPNRWNIFCSIAHPLKCLSRLTNVLQYVVPLLAYAALAMKFPNVFLAPCKILLAFCVASKAAQLLRRSPPPNQQPQVPPPSAPLQASSAVKPDMVGPPHAQRMHTLFAHKTANDMGVIVVPCQGQ